MAKTKRAMEQKRITFKEAAEWLVGRDKFDALPDNINGKRLINKKVLSFQEAIEFVANLVDSCVSEKDELFTPEGFDFTSRLGVMTMYGNFETPELVEEAYQVVYDESLYDTIARNINLMQVFALQEAANKKIEYRLKMNISTAAAKINELIAKMDEVMSAGTGILSGIETGKANKLMRSLANMETVDEKSITDALIKEFVQHERPKARSKKSTKTTPKNDSNIVVLEKKNG